MTLVDSRATRGTAPLIYQQKNLANSPSPCYLFNLHCGGNYHADW